MPQINQLLLVYQSQWFWLLLVLAVIYFGIAKGMLPKIEKTVDDRDAKIAGIGVTTFAILEEARTTGESAEVVARRHGRALLGLSL